ncbi:hypothetical protein F5Y04DRAFT_160013 [Hypomontagnella monticulosa]|nr:hypothetical protein F5Y04DRAFT_160013 [Hypomontagnella monticulosa]
MSIVLARLSILPSNDGLATPAADRIETDLVPLSTDGSKVIISGTVLLVLISLWTYLRFWCLRQNGRVFSMEDGLHLGAVVFFYGLVAADFTMVLAGGLGHHIVVLQDWHVVRLLKTIFARQLLFTASLGLIKISVVLMFMNIFFSRRFRLAAMVTIAFTITWMFLTLLLELFVCHPIEKNWNFRSTIGHCGDQRAAFASVGVVDILTQLTILMLPLPTIVKLEMEWRYKIVTACVFSIGILTLVFGIIRLYMVEQIDLRDVPYTAVQATAYGTSEVGIAIMVSSCPLLRPVFDRFFISLPECSTWREKNGGIVMSRARKGTKSSGFTQMKGDSREDLELGNMGAHRARRDTAVTVGKRPLSDTDDGSSVQRIVVTSETIVSRDKGEL